MRASFPRRPKERIRVRVSSGETPRASSNYSGKLWHNLGSLAAAASAWLPSCVLFLSSGFPRSLMGFIPLILQVPQSTGNSIKSTYALDGVSCLIPFSIATLSISVNWSRFIYKTLRQMHHTTLPSDMYFVTMNVSHLTQFFFLFSIFSGKQVKGWTGTVLSYPVQ